jgi:acarbose 7IV-phosphotransferase
MPLVVVAGPATWNLIVRVAALPAAGSPTLFAAGHRDTLGGTSAGKALGLAQLGLDVALRTVLGDDDAAAQVRTALTHPRLTLAAAVVPGATERHLNLMADDGSRVSIYLDTPGEPGPVPERVLAALGEAAVAVVDLAEHARGFLGLARAAGVPVWCDLHDWDGQEPFHRDFAAAADVVVVSDDRLPDPREFLAARVAAGARWAVCTRGARGAVALGRDEGWLEMPAVPVPDVVDTNGAGDAFVAGMLLGHLEGRPLGHCLRLGAAAGAMAVASADLVSPGMSADAIRALAGLPA